jgi:hypothetical protein
LGERPIGDDALKAFVSADFGALREIFGIPVWSPSPLTSSPCSASGHGQGVGGCSCGAVELRRRLVRELESRGGFTWKDLADPDDATAWAAWGKLRAVAADLGVPAARWAELVAEGGWEPEEEGNGDNGIRKIDRPGRPAP